MRCTLLSSTCTKTKELDKVHPSTTSNSLKLQMASSSLTAQPRTKSLSDLVQPLYNNITLWVCHQELIQLDYRNSRPEDYLHNFITCTTHKLYMVNSCLTTLTRMEMLTNKLLWWSKINNHQNNLYNKWNIIKVRISRGRWIQETLAACSTNNSKTNKYNAYSSSNNNISNSSNNSNSPTVTWSEVLKALNIHRSATIIVSVQTCKIWTQWAVHS